MGSINIRSILITVFCKISYIVDTPNSWFWLFQPEKPKTYSYKKKAN